MSKYYVKSKKYVIRPSKRNEVIKFIEDNFKGSKYRSVTDALIKNTPMYYKRWLYYFDLDYLDEILMEEDCVEISLQEKQKSFKDYTKEDLGI